MSSMRSLLEAMNRNNTEPAVTSTAVPSVLKDLETELKNSSVKRTLAEGFEQFKKNTNNPKLSLRNLTNKTDVVDYIKNDLLESMRISGAVNDQNSHTINFRHISSAVFNQSMLSESNDPTVVNGDKFLKLFKQQDQYNNMNMQVGAKVSILNLLMSRLKMELWGFLTPKTITKIHTDPTDRTITRFEFNNDPTDVWPRHDRASYNGQLIDHSAFFPTKQAAQQALTMLMLAKPEGLDVGVNINENSGDRSSISDLAQGHGQGTELKQDSDYRREQRRNRQVAATRQSTADRVKKGYGEKQFHEQQNPTDTISMDVPLLIRIMEYAKEDAKTDMDLHAVAEQLTKMSAAGHALTMQDYDDIVGVVAEQGVYSDPPGYAGTTDTHSPSPIGSGTSELEKVEKSEQPQHPVLEAARYDIRHRETGQTLSSHATEQSARHEFRGLGADRAQYRLIKKSPGLKEAMPAAVATAGGAAGMTGAATPAAPAAAAPAPTAAKPAATTPAPADPAQKAKLTQNLASLKTAGVAIDPTKAAATLQKTDTGAPLSPADKDNIAAMAPALGNVMTNPATASQFNALVKKAGVTT